MTPERRQELEGFAVQTVNGLGPVTSNDRTVLDKYALYDAITEALVQVEREVWERAAKVSLDLLREHIPGAPGVSVLQVAANRCLRQAEEAR